MKTLRRARRTLSTARRGGVYLAVLGSAMVVVILGLSMMSVARLEQLASGAAGDSVKARSYAESAVELGMLEIQRNLLWRVKANGAWETNRPIGDGAYTLEVTDPIDGNLANDSRDPVVVRGTGLKGQARHILEVTMVDTGDPVKSLSSALAGAGGVRVESGRSLMVSLAPVSSNATLTNNGTITGNAEALLILGSGTITGTSSILSLGNQMPPAGIHALYAKLGTQISPGSDLERAVLAPRYTTYGPTNNDGIYVVNAPGGLRIRDVRIHGTLVVIAPGATVRVENVHMQSYRPDCPALIVHGDLVLASDRTAPVSEAGVGVNFNPPLAPYEGAGDTDQFDQYPCEIRGLVHVTGTLLFEQKPRVVGGVIAEGAPLLAPGVVIDGDPQIAWDPDLKDHPPIGYSATPIMEERPGSWKRVTLP
jgi:Tfp pilus assembly protein PilX